MEQPPKPTIVVQPRAPYASYRAGMDAKTLAEEAKKEEDRYFDDDEPWSLPITHQITENLDRSNLVQASLDTAIPADNVGYRLLQKMGWKAGSGLGRDGSGIVEPIRTQLKEDVLGIGKKEQEDEMAEVATKRKALEIEIERTEEEKRRKLDQHLEKEKIKEEVTEMNRVFFCEICSKQYTQALQYDQHLSSYDHHHKKRLADMAKQARAMKKTFGKTDKRKKEERREQEMLKRITEEANRRAAASGEARVGDASAPAGFQPAPPAAPPTNPPPPPPPTIPPPQPQQPPASAFPAGFVPVTFTSSSSASAPPPSGGFQPVASATPSGGFQPAAFAPVNPSPSGFQTIPSPSSAGSTGFKPVSLGNRAPPPPPGNPPPPPSTPAPPPPSHPPPPPPSSQPPPPPPDTPAQPAPAPKGTSISFGISSGSGTKPKPPMRFSFAGKK